MRLSPQILLLAGGYLLALHIGSEMRIQADAQNYGPAPAVSTFAREVLPTKRISREQFRRLQYLRSPQSFRAMRDFLGIPAYAFANVEYFPLREDPQVWIGLVYDPQNFYQGFLISIENEVYQ